MSLLLTGATGFIGTHLVQRLREHGFQDFVFLTRSPEKAKRQFPFPCRIYPWDPMAGAPPQQAWKGVEYVINLAGEPIIKARWTAKQKDKIKLSRVLGTRHLIEGMEKQGAEKPLTFISASAIGIYGNRGEETLTENSPPGQGFLSEVCREWEHQVQQAPLGPTRKVIVRIGLVLSSDGGALKKMLLPFKLGLGGRLGTGQQYMSWIHLHDLLELFAFLLKTPQAQGIYNGVSPHPVRNSEFTKTLGQVLGRPTPFPVPRLALKSLMGEVSSILLDGQKVLPQRTMEQNFNFRFPQLQAALHDLLT